MVHNVTNKCLLTFSLITQITTNQYAPICYAVCLVRDIRTSAEETLVVPKMRHLAISLNIMNHLVICKNIFDPCSSVLHDLGDILRLNGQLVSISEIGSGESGSMPFTGNAIGFISEEEDEPFIVSNLSCAYLRSYRPEE